MLELTQREIQLFRRLIKELELPGKFDELIVELALDPKNLPSREMALAQIARAILIQLKLRIPPELERLAAMFPSLDREHARRRGVCRDRPGATTAPLPVAPLMRELMNFGCVLVALLFIGFLAFVLVGRYDLAFGTIVLMVVLAIVLLVVLVCFPGGPRTIPEAQFEAEVHSSREEFFPRSETEEDGVFRTDTESLLTVRGTER